MLTINLRVLEIFATFQHPKQKVKSTFRFMFLCLLVRFIRFFHAFRLVFFAFHTYKKNLAFCVSLSFTNSC